MIPNPVSSPKNMTQIQQPTEVTEEEPLYVNAKQVDSVFSCFCIQFNFSIIEFWNDERHAESLKPLDSCQKNAKSIFTSLVTSKSDWNFCCQANLLNDKLCFYMNEFRHAMARQRGDGGRFHTANNNATPKKNSNGKKSLSNKNWTVFRSPLPTTATLSTTKTESPASYIGTTEFAASSDG